MNLLRQDNKTVFKNGCILVISVEHNPRRDHKIQRSETKPGRQKNEDFPG